MANYPDAIHMRRVRGRAFHAQGGLCFWCAEPMLPNHPDDGDRDPKICTGDHLVARAFGGRVVTGNIVAACKACNLLRGTGRELESKLMAQGYVFAMPALASAPALNRSAGKRDGVIYSVGAESSPVWRRARNGAVTYTAEGWPVVPAAFGAHP